MTIVIGHVPRDPKCYGRCYANKWQP